ncbi:uncharacterized protein LOC125645678 isoform X3 [Ostrea edulis]|uniref:uncharacterized protein LOC125645678 isoform X3 n=1 Tax=Ostrea edulis TaxID=37623 RepID=UPI002094C88F|nr:uncharacterized protein LOC125645678 isoform X3 [Ostrea edulis]
MNHKTQQTMPASDLSWSPQRQPLCHGIKRKLSAFERSAENEMDEETEEGAVSGKRKCISHTTDISHDMNNMFEINHNDEQSYDLNNFTDNNNSNTVNLNTVEYHNQQMGHDMSSMEASSQGFGSNQMTNVFVQQSKLTCIVISHNQNKPSSQGDMIMDLNDETYSNTQIDICSGQESPCVAMDSDYVPNPEQYQLSRGSNSCGDAGYYTNTVRSYCRPHWDNQDLCPYVSDYY